MESLGTSTKRNDGCDEGWMCSVADQSLAAAPATLTEKQAMKKKEEKQKVDFALKFLFLCSLRKDKSSFASSPWGSASPDLACTNIG